MKDLNDLKINCTEKLLTPVLTKFALKYETMAQKIVEHANENTLKIDNVRLVCSLFQAFRYRRALLSERLEQATWSVDRLTSHHTSYILHDIT